MKFCYGSNDVYVPRETVLMDTTWFKPYVLHNARIIFLIADRLNKIQLVKHGDERHYFKRNKIKEFFGEITC